MGYAPKADVVLIGGKIFTNDPERPWVEALAIKDEFVLVAGSEAQVLARKKKDTIVYHLDGRTVIPGFNNAHVHVDISVGHTLPEINIPGPGPDRQTLKKQILDAVASKPKGTWITAKIGESIIDDQDFRRQFLDQLAPENPIWLRGWGGHLGILNSKGLEALNIKDSIRNPIGGEYLRDKQDRLTGEVWEYAERSVMRKLAQTQESIRTVKYYRDYAHWAVTMGITSIQEMGRLPLDQRAALWTEAKTPLRVRIICYPFDLEEYCLERHRLNTGPTDKLVVSGTKWILDGTPIERLAANSAYKDRPNWRGFETFTDNHLAKILAKKGNMEPGIMQLLFHSVGDLSVRTLFKAISKLPQSLEKQRLRIEHGDFLTKKDLAFMKEHHLMLVQNPLHLGVPEMMHTRFGRERMGHSQLLRSYLDQKLVLAFGSDSQRGNPFVELMLAVTHPTNPDEAISVEEAVRAYTYGSAYAEFMEHEKGVLKSGYYADLAVLSQDIFTVEPKTLPQTKVLLTMIDGAVVHHNVSLKCSYYKPKLKIFIKK